MARTIPMIITNKNILIKSKDSDEFIPFDMPGIERVMNIPFYHQFAERLAESQVAFKNFVREVYGKKLTKNIFAIIIPDDTSALESIFINEFFVNSGACKAVAQMTMGQALSKNDQKYISISKSSRNIALQYINNNEVRARMFYDLNDYSTDTILRDAKRLHIDVEYEEEIPVFINNFNMDMDDFLEFGTVITPKMFMEKIAVIDVEKL